MRVLIDVSAVPDPPVGVGTYLLNLVGELDQCAPDVEIHLLARKGARNPDWRAVAPRAVLHPVVPAGRPARLTWEQTRAPSLARRLGIDVWHGTHYTMPLRLTVPAVVTVHDTSFFEHPEWHERSKALFFRTMTRAAAARAAALVAVSEFTARRIETLLAPACPVLTVPHGVDLVRFTPAAAADPADLAVLETLGVRPPYLAFVGTLEPRKGVPDLVGAFAHLAQGHPELRLVLAGRQGWGLASIRDAFATSGVTTRIVRPGYIPDLALAPLLRQAECVVYPSHLEGFGLPALEALACGAALVTAQGSAMEEVAGTAALVVPPGDVEMLADTIERVLTDDGLRSKLRAAGPPIAAEHTWGRSAAGHLAAYRTAVSARRAAA